jgi:hypothetical protein
LPDSDRLLAKINADQIQYAPAISADGLELFYTRLTGALFWQRAQIMHATRATTADPYGPPQLIESITEFAEAPSISADGRYLYFHQRVNDSFRIYRATRDR